MSDEKSWIVIAKTDNDYGSGGIKVLTDAEGQIFDMSVPEQIEEMIILHNTQTANIILERDTALQRLENLEEDAQELQEQLDAEEGDYTWPDLVYDLAHSSSFIVGLILIILAINTPAIIRAAQDAQHPTSTLEKSIK